MRVILQQDVPNLGHVGDILKVRDGYGRNFLVPRGLAVVADDRNVSRLQHQKKVAAVKATKELAQAKIFAEQIEANPITIRQAAGEDSRLFGAVTNRDIAEALLKDGLEIDRRNIVLSEPIKTIGLHHLQIRLDRGVTASLKVYVVEG